MPSDNATIHVGGLSPSINSANIHATFILFGDILEIHFPTQPDSHPPRHRGFAFVEFTEPGDARAAVDNMHLAEIEGAPIRVSMAKQFRHQDLGGRAVWTDEAWLRDQGYIQDESVPVTETEVDAGEQDRMVVDADEGAASSEPAELAATERLRQQRAAQQRNPTSS